MSEDPYRHARAAQEQRLDVIDNSLFDVAIVGGGINGACLYHHLCHRGFRVLLVERGDFSCGTSQASAMMIWGGLVYLKDLELATVWRLCAARDRMVAELGDWVRPCTVSYVPVPEGRSRPWAQLGLYLYWLLGHGRGRRPRHSTRYPEQAFLDPGRLRGALHYQEAVVEPSDASFVLQWLLVHDNDCQVAVNYCALGGGGYEADRKAWRLELSDGLDGRQILARARLVVNAAGPETDLLNDRFERPSPYVHVLSKGVSIGIPRPPQHRHHLAFDYGEAGNAMTLVPWGPISVWGSTDTLTTRADKGTAIEPTDIDFLLDQLNRHMAHSVDRCDIVSLRHGLRPLAVRRGEEIVGTGSLSRGHRLHRDPGRTWISVYGGKLTGCVALAQTVADLVGETTEPTAEPTPATKLPDPASQTEIFPALTEPVPAAAWCLQRQRCWNLEDYLRRRTNIAQWVPRGGLGRDDEHVDHLRRVATVLSGGDEHRGRQALEDYRQLVRTGFDQALAVS